ncbi:lipase family protein [Halobacillus yeomjeoni]|uniref:lipase family protein n=1 Tax=Halobacillus yeomjeoni TaxID=311194 RepID=UPI001CD26FA4|nr:lipase family protein [Halobacillus yeomjeoni]MCA0984666.1 lipase family protein [Halobacillus yeomjeoni]
MTTNVAFNKDLALNLLKIARLASTQYEKHNKFPIPKGYRLIKSFKASALGKEEWFGFIIASKHSIIISFRGTKSPLDWLVDSEVGQVSFHGGKVHRGFLSVYKSCKKQIFHAYSQLIQNTEDKTLYITGHSLGAGLATLHALDAELSDIGFKKIVMYNYASPRVGDRHFASIYNDHVLYSVRFVNTNDLVPKLPGEVVKREGQTWYYTHVHSEVDFTLKYLPHSVKFNHSFGAYRKGIKRL